MRVGRFMGAINICCNCPIETIRVGMEARRLCVCGKSGGALGRDACASPRNSANFWRLPVNEVGTMNACSRDRSHSGRLATGKMLSSCRYTAPKRNIDGTFS